MDGDTSLGAPGAAVDRAALTAGLAAAGAGAGRDAAVALLRRALADGRAEIGRRLDARPYDGDAAAAAYARLTDDIVGLAHGHVVASVYPLANPTAAERLTLMAVGGYGRGEMAPHSDVDLVFVTPWKPTPWTEQAIEATLYLLWDLGLKVGHASRSLDDVIRLAAADHTIRTATLEARLVAGDAGLFDAAMDRFRAEVAAGGTEAFVAEKLAERDARHRRMGDSRYVVEPNVKEGKGGLRDLHALFWIGKFVHGARTVDELAGHGLFSRAELGRFRRASRFLWAVRCHLHLLAGRAEERLSFEYQREIAARMRYADRPGRPAVERFMRHYFLHARTVGTLTGIFLAHLDDMVAARGRRFGLPALRRRPRRLEGFVLDRGRLALPHDGFLAERPARLIDLFALADRHRLEIHPLAMRAAERDARRIDGAVRGDPDANARFLDILTSPRDPELVLRWMNEAGVLGRFVPDFGRVVARMQFDMYHHYTVDEHTIRAIGLLARIEQGALKEDHPLSTALFRRIASRRALYVAVLLHDIAKGRGGDHSVLGAEVALSLCPRLGLDAAETETVAWLVARHLIMSATAFKRDLADPQTIEDFAGTVKSMERLRLLMLLTVVDIRAVGPGTWNGWKRQLLRALFEATEERLRLGHKQKGRPEQVAAAQERLRARLGWDEARFAPYRARLPDSYWLAEPDEVIADNAGMIGALPAAAEARLSIGIQADRGATLVSVHARDQPGLFYRVAGAISLAGGNIIDARIHTTADGMALDNFLVHDAAGTPFADPHRLQRLRQAVADALAGQEPMLDRLDARAPPAPRADAFAVRPAVFVDNQASSRYTVIEVNARDRPALLTRLAEAVFRSRATIRSAHVATYGERAVDVFYITGLRGRKLAGASLARVRAALLEAASGAA